MSDAEHELARRIIRMLDDDRANPSPVVQEQLAAARRAALARYQQEEPARAWTSEPAAALARGSAHSRRQTARFRAVLVGAALLCAIALGLTFTWPKHKQADIAEIDAGLLTDDLPINAYLDRGFDSWLKRVSR